MKHAFVLMLAAFLSVGAVTRGSEVGEAIYPTGVAVPTDPDLKSMKWHKFGEFKANSSNFTILSINEQQGQYLYNNIEKIKTWVYTRWGLEDQYFKKECRVLCVDRRDIYKKLFKIDESAVEYRDNMTVVWLVLDDKPSRTVPGPLTEVCLSEYEWRTGVKVPWWARRGMARLNGHLADIRADMGYLYGVLKADQAMYWSESLMGMTQEKYAKESADKRLLYDRQAEALCLLMRKEYGQAQFQKVIFSKVGSEDTLKDVLGFRGYAHFDSTFKRYMIDLSSDVLRSRTPDSYLDIRPAPKKK